MSDEAAKSEINRLNFLIAEFAQRHYPGFRSAALRIVLADGEVARLPVSSRVLINLGNPTLRSGPGEMRAAILDALTEAAEVGKEPNGEELADLAGYPYHSKFRQKLSEMVKSKEIVNKRPGYVLGTE